MKESQDHDITSPDAEPDFAGRAGRQDRVVMNHNGIVAVVCILIVAILWCLETWQRPGISKRVPDWVLFMLVSFGVLGGALRLGFVRKSAARWWMAFAFCVCGFALLAGMRPLCGKLTLYHLESRIDQQISNPGPSLEAPRKPISARLVGTLEWLRLGVPNWLAEHAARPNAVRSRSLPESLIASSRLPLRRAAADSMLSNHKRSKFLMEHWKDYFPAIIGADVRLEHRRDWMWHLNALREDDSLTSTSRQAAVFCMALVILTDPPELEEWRIPVRDAMLGWRKPLAPSITDEWMRTIDTLLALDPPELWVGLTAPLTTNHDQFRYAMRVPVRGLAGNFDALMREFELMESRNQTEHGFALWQGAGASLEHWPDQVEELQVTQIQNWRRDVLFRWLMDHSRGTRRELTETKGRVLLELTPQQQDQLAASAAEWARMAVEEVNSAGENASLSDSRPLKILLLIHPYLKDRQRLDIQRLLIPVMLRPELFRKSRFSSTSFDSNWVEWLWKIQPQMSADERRFLNHRLVPSMEKLYLEAESSAFLLCLDAWSDTPALTPEAWLAMAWQCRRGWKIVPRSTPREQLDPSGDGPLPAPALPDHVVLSLGRYLDAAYSSGDHKIFVKSLERDLIGSRQTTPHPSSLAFRCFQSICNWRASEGCASNSIADMLKMELSMRGLCKLDDHGLRTLKELAGNAELPSRWIEGFYQSDLQTVLWGDINRDPQTAVNEVLESLGHESGSLLLGCLIAFVEKSAPDTVVVRSIWDSLRQRSQIAPIKHKTEIFGALFRLSHLIPLDERLAMRRDVLTFRAIGLWPFSDNDGMGHFSGGVWSPSALLFPGGGLGIPWEDDELSALYSWRTDFRRQVHRETYLPSVWRPNDGFHFLARGSFPQHGYSPWEPSPIAMQPPTAPFEATPWQRARELHLRRPDLDVR